MPDLDLFDQRHYPRVAVRDGYGRWAETYEATVKPDMDLWLLDAITTVDWSGISRAADLGCGTGRTGAWLASRGVSAIDGVDLTPEMLGRARARGIFTELRQADVCATGLTAEAYDLVTTCLVDEHLADLAPFYRETARLAKAGAAHVVVGYHPFFIMKTGMPTHFNDAAGQPTTIETRIHLLSDHVRAAMAAGWQLTEFHEQVIDDRWIRTKPSWAAHRGIPISFAAVWRKAA